jgi:hypothetical protein
VRRHLAGVDLRQLQELLSTGVLTAPVIGRTLRDDCAQLLEKGEQRFALAVERRTLTSEERHLSTLLSWEVSLVVDPGLPHSTPDREFLGKVLSSNPNFTGWPVWLDSRSFTDETARPNVREGGWEALVVSLRQDASHHLDFWRFEPAGKFYLRRLLQDDALPNRVEPKTVLDPILVIIRVAEAIAVGLAISNALELAPESRLGFMFRWKPLRGRRLTPWANPWVSVSGGHADDNEATSFVEVPAETPVSAIAPFVDAATTELFSKFEGYRFPQAAVEEWCQRLIERRLNA